MKIRRLTIQFDYKIQNREIAAFRGAIASKVGKDNSWFHQHLEDEKLAYRYPLIQYKSIRKQASVLCLGTAVDEIHKLFNKEDWIIHLKGKKVDLEIDNLDLGNVTLNVWDKSFPYALTNWLALNERNYQRFMAMENEIDQIEMLERILIGNILAFAKGVGWKVEKEIKLRIHKIVNKKSLKYKNTQLLAFDVDFSTNVFLPNYIGLGKGASHGYGMVFTKNKN